MRYGKDFWCLDLDGTRLPGLVWPLIQAFKYPDGDRGWWLRRDYGVEFVFRGVLWRLTAKAGFDFDGASIPKFAWSIIGDPLALDILIAALFHDLQFCCHHAAWPLGLTNVLFLEIQKASESSRVKRNLTTKVVQAAGWSHWKKTPEEIAKYEPFLVAENLGLAAA